MQTCIRFLFLFLIFLVSAAGVRAQLECGTVTTEEDLAALSRVRRQVQQFQLQQSLGSRTGTAMTGVPIQIHVLRRDDGSGGLTIGQIDRQLQLMNELYRGSGMYFYECSPVNYIDSTKYFQFDAGLEEADLRDNHSIVNVVNIYFADSVAITGTPVCGYAYLPGGFDFMILDNDCGVNGTTLSHEMGHYMGLLHTHETSAGAELVDGSNCLTAGDGFCDTPADPNVSGLLDDNAACAYTGTATDANGDAYSPDVTNIMSYAARACRDGFSDDQLAYMGGVLATSRAYLTCGSPPALDAEFYSVYDPDDCGNTLSVSFSDVSLGSPTAWNWNFGDGNFAVAQNPSHTYTAPGVYTVSLTADPAGGADVETKTAHIAVGPVSIPYTNGFEGGTSDLGEFRIEKGFKNREVVSTLRANTGTHSLLLTGFSEWNSPFFQIPALGFAAFDSLMNLHYQAKAFLCVDATTMSAVTLSFDYFLEHFSGISNAYTSFRVTINGAQVGTIYQPAGTDGPWTTETINLDAYAGTVFTIGFESSALFDTGYAGSEFNGVFLDNINITGTPAVLPVAWLDLAAQPKQTAVDLQWQVSGDETLESFLVERSEDSGRSWAPVGAVSVPLSPAGDYHFLDTEVRPATTYAYRLQSVDLNGGTEYSPSVEVTLPAAGWQLYPTVAEQGQVTLVYPEDVPLSSLTLTNSLGQQWQLNPARISGRSDSRKTLQLAGFPAGWYLLKIEAGTQPQNFRILIP